MAYISALTVLNFRNYDKTQITDLNDRFIVLHGENGAGKTNILEAVSLLCPGRGLRGAKINEIQNQNVINPWVVSGKLETDYGQVQIGTGRDGVSDKRITRIDGETVKSQNHLSEYTSCLWLTPQMDGLFTGGASERRRFFDRLITSFDPSHNGRLQRYENAQRQRMKILSDETRSPDTLWLQGLEKTIAETGVALSAARMEFIEKLNLVTLSLHEAHATGDFPQASFFLKGEVEEMLENQPAVAVEDAYQAKLEDLRLVDAKTKAVTFGAHKSDIETTHLDKGAIASQCSTGEQKGLLTGIILAHRHMLANAKRQMPILLLDEVAAHFDKKRRSGLFHFLDEIGGQVWMTGTDIQLFDAVPAYANRFIVKEGKISLCG